MRQSRHAAKPGRGERGQGRKPALTEEEEIEVGLHFLEAREQAIATLSKAAVDQAKERPDVQEAARKLRMYGLGEDRRDDYRSAVERALGLPEDLRVTNGTRSIGLAPLVRRLARNYGRNQLAEHVAIEMSARYGVRLTARYVMTCATKARAESVN